MLFNWKLLHVVLFSPPRRLECYIIEKLPPNNVCTYFPWYTNSVKATLQLFVNITSLV